MKLRLLSLISFATLLSFPIEAQMFTPAKTAPAPKTEIKTEATPTPTDTPLAPTAEDILAKIEADQIETEPVTMTPEQKAAVKKPLVEQIMGDVDKASPKERRELIKVMEQMQKVQTRRQNLNLPEDRQIKLEEPRVNAASKDEVQKYLQDKLVAPIDRTMNIQ